MRVQSLGWEDPCEKEMATTPVFLPGKSLTEEPGGLQFMGLQKSWTWLSKSTTTLPHMGLEFALLLPRVKKKKQLIKPAEKSAKL